MGKKINKSILHDWENTTYITTNGWNLQYQPDKSGNVNMIPQDANLLLQLLQDECQWCKRVQNWKVSCYNVAFQYILISLSYSE